MEPSVAAALPGWVGRRVVVRHMLPDGRATDVLGTLVSAVDGVVVVRRDRLRDGEGEEARTVILDGASVLLAKPVPPPVSRRAPGRR